MRITGDALVTAVEVASALKKLSLSLFRVFPDSSRVERGDFVPALALEMATETKGVPEGMVRLDPPPVSRDAAVEIVVHHLALAATYFEATPDDRCAQLLEEVERQRRLGCLSEHQGHAAVEFVHFLDNFYESLKCRSEDEK